MKKWTKLFSLAIGALMAIGAAVGVKQTAERVNAAESYQQIFAIDCEKASQEGSETLYGVGSTTQMKDAGVLSFLNYGAGSNIFSSASVSDKVYWAKGSGGTGIPSNVLKIGTASGSGGISFTYSGTDNISKVSITGYGWKDTTAISVNSSAKQKPAAAATAETFDFVLSAPTKTISINITTSALCASSIVCYKQISSADVVHVTGVSVTPSSATVKEGETVQLSASVNPAEATDKSVSWESSDGSIASVSSNGLVTGLKTGSATITCTTTDLEFQSSCVITVTSKYDAPVGITVGSSYVMTGVNNTTNYELTGISSGLGTAESYASLPDGDYVLKVVNGVYSNTVAFQNGTNYLEYHGSDNKLYTATEINANSSWTVSMEDGLYVISNVASDARTIRFNYNSGSTRFACYGSSSALPYVNLVLIDTTPKAAISSGSQNILTGGNTMQFNLQTQFIDAVSSKVWSLTPNTVSSTISNDGLLTTGNKMEEFDVACKINGTIDSNSIHIRVWLNNENTISLADAIEVANFTGTNESQYLYTVEGKVKSINPDNANEFVITDKTETNDLTIYEADNNLNVGDYVEASGKIKTNNGAPSMRNDVTLTNFFTVTFESDGEKYDQVLVKNGEKVDKPTDPTPTGSKPIFAGWFNGNIEWDFDTNVVTDNLTLVAKWSSGLDTSAQLNIKYNYNEAIAGQQFTDVLTSSTLISNTSGSYNNFSEVEMKTSNAVYAGCIAYATATSYKGAIQLKSKDSISGIVSSTSSGTVKSISFVVASGSNQIDVYGSNNPYTNATDLYDDSSKGTLIGSSTTSATIIFEGNYQYFGLRSNDGSAYLTNITIVWDTGSPLTITSVNEYNLRFSCELTADQIAPISPSAHWQYGFMVAQTDQMKKNKTFEESYECLQNGLKDSEDPIMDVAAGAMETGEAKISTYVNKENPLPTLVGDKYEFSVNVKIPEANLKDSVSAVWFAYNTDTDEMVFASQKNMSIKDICSIYAGMGGLSEHQQAAINYIAALAA